MAKKMHQKKRNAYTKISEFYMGKYDDITREERAILSQMDSGGRIVWTINDFRNIPSMSNSGEKIGELLAQLVKKDYIRRSLSQRGYMLEDR